jgi:hypothetical protein
MLCSTNSSRKTVKHTEETVKGQRNLTRNSFIFAQDPTGEQYVTMTESEASKTTQED